MSDPFPIQHTTEEVPEAMTGITELVVADPYAGLRAALRDNVGDRMTLHVLGGNQLVQVSGKIMEVEDTLVTVRSGRTPTFVPLHVIVIAEEDPS